MAESKVFSLRLPVELVDRLDGVRGVVSRNEFVRRSVEAALSGVRDAQFTEVEREVSGGEPPAQINRLPKTRKLKSEAGLSPNGKILLEAVRKRGAISRREVKKDFGWDDGALLKAALDVRDRVQSDTEGFWV